MPITYSHSKEEGLTIEEDNSAALELQELPKPATITYYLALFSESEMKKTVKQWKSNNTFLQLKLDFKWDTVKAQFLMKVSEMLRPKLIDFNAYDFLWNIPHLQVSQMQLQMDGDYKFLITHTLKMKEPVVNVRIEARIAKKGKMNDSGTEHESSGNSSNSDSSTSADVKCVKKKSKKMSRGSKKNKEMMLNKDIEEKIKLLCNRWECSKMACASGSAHCFIHLENVEHFTLSHNHLAIWGATWQCGPEFADLEKPPNHVKFNNVHAGQASKCSPLVQQHMAEHNQAISTTPIVNFNLPPELFNTFCPPATKPASPVQSTPVAVTTNSLLPESAMPGPCLTLSEFCAAYSLSDNVCQKLDDNGYMGSNTISYICVSELKDMGFKHSEITAMKDAVRRWIASN
ncbi:hypothetical protein EDC04DRAFT_2901316 [Pisolithus marmoratus]|nr:hypothetical protein EDC04DRAFT_2901316 [Pisolithus marmoratus]